MNVSKCINLFYWAIVLITLAFNSHCQISTDGSLGPAAQNLQGPDYAIGEELGKRAGNNLFHSFQKFNINAGESATFTGDAAIERVISRVTGGNVSNIDGLLKSEIPDADFFLVNPAGVMFGPDASIDISGSFSVSTADYLKFGDNDQFFSQPLENEVLSANAPTAYGFLGADIGTITFDRSELSADEGDGMSIIGGDIDARGSGLEAPEGNINLVSVESEGEVKLINSESGVIEFDVESFTDFGQISLTDGTEINVDGEGGGSVNILGENMTIDESSIIATTTGSTPGENIDIKLTGSLTLLRGAGILSLAENTGDVGNINISANSIFLDSKGVASTGILTVTVLEKGGGKGGDITIDTAVLQVLNGGQINVITTGSGDGGNLNLTADTILVDRQESPFVTLTGISAQTQLINGGGKGGDITINTSNLQVLNGGQINVITFGSGVGGTLNLTAETILVNRQESPFVTAISAGTLLEKGGGKGGNITINTSDLQVLNGGQIDVITTGDGDGGTLNLIAETIIVDRQGSPFVTRISVGTELEQGGGKGGDMTINTSDLQVLNGGRIDVITFGSGAGGTLNLSAETILVDPQDSPFVTTISAGTALEQGGGKGGDITINSSDVQVLNGGQIDVNTIGSGDGGTLNLIAETILVDRQDSRFATGILAQTILAEGGKGGDIIINTSDLRLLNGGTIGAPTFGSGAGGTLNLSAETILVDRQDSPFVTGIIAATVLEQGGGKGGDMTIDTKKLQVLNGGAISATTFGSGGGGTLNLSAETILVDRQDSPFVTSISAGTVLAQGGGKGGDMTIDTKKLQVLNGGAVSATTFGSGDGGTLKLTAETILVNRQDSPFVTSLSAGTELEQGGGKGGDMTIDSFDLQVLNGGQIGVITTGSGAGGTLELTAETILVNRQGSPFVTTISAQTQSNENGGKGGDMTINTSDLQVLNGGLVDVITTGSGAGGTLELTAEAILVNGQDSPFITGISAGTVLEQGGGKGGDMTIITSDLQVFNGGAIRATTFGSGDGGGIRLRVNSMVIGAEGAISTEGTGEGPAGNIRIESSEIRLSKGQITTQAASDGGNITINSNEFIQLTASNITAEAANNGGNITMTNGATILENSRLRANATEGNGGNVSINTNGFFANVNGLFVEPEEVINVSSELGVSGNIKITAPNIDLSAGLVPLSEDFLNVDSLSLAKCSRKYERGEINTFHILEREGISPAPDDLLPNFFPSLRAENE